MTDTPKEHFEKQNAYWERILNELAFKHGSRPVNDIVRMKIRQDIRLITEHAKEMGQEPALKRALARRGVKL